MNPYASDKAAFHADRLALLRVGEQPYPVHVQLVPADECNQSCHFCAYRLEGYSSNALFALPMADGSRDNNPRRYIPWPKLQQIVADCAAMGVRAIQLTGGGEPTLHRHFDDLCRLIVDSGIELALVTNGLLLKRERATWLARNATWLRVSIDAGQAETYASVRQVPVAEFGIVAQNVRTLCSTPRRTCTVGVGFVVTLENHREVALATRRTKEWGADNLRISAFFQNDGADYYERQGILPAIAEQRRQAAMLASDGFQVWDNFGSRQADLEDGPPDYRDCGYMQFTTYIGGDQNVYTCCVNAYNPCGLIGSIAEQSFRALWDGEIKRRMFSGFDARKCPRCMFNEKNQTIARLVGQPRGHAAFV